MTEPVSPRTNRTTSNFETNNNRAGVKQPAATLKSSSAPRRATAAGARKSKLCIGRLDSWEEEEERSDWEREREPARTPTAFAEPSRVGWRHVPVVPESCWSEHWGPEIFCLEGTLVCAWSRVQWCGTVATAITDAKKPAQGLMSTASETSLLLLYSTTLSTLYPNSSATHCLCNMNLSLSLFLPRFWGGSYFTLCFYDFLRRESKIIIKCIVIQKGLDPLCGLCKIWATQTRTLLCWFDYQIGYLVPQSTHPICLLPRSPAHCCLSPIMSIHCLWYSSRAGPVLDGYVLDVSEGWLELSLSQCWMSLGTNTMESFSL